MRCMLWPWSNDDNNFITWIFMYSWVFSQKKISFAIFNRKVGDSSQTLVSEITFWHGCSPVNLLHIFGTPFPGNTSEWLLLNFIEASDRFPDGHFWPKTNTCIYFLFIHTRLSDHLQFTYILLYRAYCKWLEFCILSRPPVFCIIFLLIYCLFYS